MENRERFEAERIKLERVKSEAIRQREEARRAERERNPYSGLPGYSVRCVLQMDSLNLLHVIGTRAIEMVTRSTA